MYVAHLYFINCVGDCVGDDKHCHDNAYFQETKQYFRHGKSILPFE